MRILLLAAALLLPSVAKAQTQNFVMGSSCTYTTVTLSTSAPTRVDDLYTNGTHQVLNSRNEVFIQNMLTSGTTVYGGYDASVSSQTTSAYQGVELPAGGWLVRQLKSSLRFYLLPASGTPPRIHVNQCAPTGS